MLYQIIYSDKKDKKRIVTPHPVRLLQAIRTVRGLSDYKVNPHGDYTIRPAAKTSGLC